MCIRRRKWMMKNYWPYHQISRTFSPRVISVKNNHNFFRNFKKNICTTDIKKSIKNMKKCRGINTNRKFHSLWQLSKTIFNRITQRTNFKNIELVLFSLVNPFMSSRVLFRKLSLFSFMKNLKPNNFHTNSHNLISMITRNSSTRVNHSIDILEIVCSKI